MSKNLEILKGIDFNNLNDEGLKKLLIDKFNAKKAPMAATGIENSTTKGYKKLL